MYNGWDNQTLKEAIGSLGLCFQWNSSLPLPTKKGVLVSEFKSQMEEQNPTQKFHAIAYTEKGMFSVIMTFPIRDNKFLWTCQSSTDCWSLMCTTKMEQISLLSASPKAEKLSFSSYSSSNQNIKSWGSSPCSSPVHLGRQLELRQILALTKQSRAQISAPSFLPLILPDKRERRNGLL